MRISSFLALALFVNGKKCFLFESCRELLIGSLHTLFLPMFGGQNIRIVSIRQSGVKPLISHHFCFIKIARLSME